ncbi:mevalonate kinase [Alkalibacterium sp. 20]|uniref:mevalonate kinase n=1 Tax=Alkalibacterium sp. 20 TaxID=1798803 RepID=UPI0009004727|nr:mevalonate kinase [Alkalibacterium sp. 20]OJF93085.1 mevalonate kinase [Alkalibacterium sp. 20]
MKTLPEQAKGFAHGKIILMGEHAVVYGEPAIALPFRATPVEVTIEKIATPNRIISSYYQGLLCEAPRSLNNLSILIKTICNDLNQSSDHLSITITSSIPAERGMGSSAAVATALVRALFTYYDEQLDASHLLNYVDLSEKIAHGNPSGIDARVTSSDVPIFYQKGSVFEPFTLNIAGYLIASDTGVQGQTRQTVKDVADQVKRSPDQTMVIIKRLGRLTLQAKEAIEKNQEVTLGKLMTQAHELLRQLNVSNDLLDQLVETALSHGALGAKLTGGGRGGCMIALTRTKKEAELVSNKLMEQGAVNTWIHALGADNEG